MMTWNKRRLRPFSILLLSGCLCLGAPVSSSVMAQAPEAAAGGEGGEEKGRYLDGYLLMLMLAGMVLFVVGKTARR